MEDGEASKLAPPRTEDETRHTVISRSTTPVVTTTMPAMPRCFTMPARDLDPALLEEPARILRGGGVVAFPTETVYGLGVVASLPSAVLRLTELKRRPDGKPYSYHLSHVSQVKEVAGNLPFQAQKLIDRYFPGPLTLVVPAGKDSGQEYVGLRVPANDIARKLIELVGSPLLVPSANPSGAPPAISAQEVLHYFGDEIDAVVDGGTCCLKQASTVVKVTEAGYQVLREGIITRDMVHQLLEGRRFLFVCTGNTCRSPMAAEIFQRRLAERLGKSPEDLGELGYRIESAGTFAARGNRASEYAVEVLREQGGDLSRHLSQPVTVELLTNADRVLALGHSNYKAVELLREEVPIVKRPHLEMLSEAGIADPVGGELHEYRECAREIEKAIERLLPR